MKKSKILTAVCIMAAMMAAGCGSSSMEKVKEVQGVYAELVSRHNEVIEEYADVADESLSKQLDEMAAQINSIGQQDMKEKTDKEIDAIITELRTNIATYDDILENIRQIENGNGETPEGFPVTIKNNTGLKLYQLYLYEASAGDKGKNLVEDMEYLDGYDTINILNLYIEESNPVWHLEAYDETGNVIESADVDFSEMGEGNAYIRMEFSFDSMEGWLETEPEAAEEEAK